MKYKTDVFRKGGIISSLKDIHYELVVDDLSEPSNEFIGLVQETSGPPVASQEYPVVVLCLKRIQSIDITFMRFVRYIRITGLSSTRCNVTSDICEISDYRLV